MNIRLNLSCRQRGRRIDMLLLPQQERLSQPVLSRCRNAPFWNRSFRVQKKSVFDCWTGALETIYAWVGTWGWRERKSWWPLGCRRRWLCNHPEESFQTFEPQHRLCSQGIISARNIVSKICCLPVTPNMPARKIYGIMNEYTNVFLKGGAGGWGRCRMYKAHNFPQWKWI